MATATVRASRSDIGNDIHTPVTPSVCGSHSISGIRNITWRVRLRSIDLAGEPMLWKKQVMTMGIPTIENAHSVLRRQCTVTPTR